MKERAKPTDRLIKRTLVAAFVLVGFAAATTSANAATDHLTQANQLVNDIDAQALVGNLQNGFGTPTVVLFKSDPGGAKVYAECSTFVTRLLSKCYGWNWSTINGGGTSSPNAAEYYSYIQAGPVRGFTTIPSLFNIQPGDIISSKYKVPTPATGHVMIALKADAVPHTFKYNVNDGHQGTYTYYCVQVVDVTSGQHGPNFDGAWTDTRYCIPGVAMSGVGRGWFSMIVDAAGKPLGWGFSRTPYANSVHWQDIDPIAIGRLNLPAK